MLFTASTAAYSLFAYIMIVFRCYTALAHAQFCLGISINSLLVRLPACLPVCLCYWHHASTRFRYYHPESVQQPWWMSAIHHVLRERKIVLFFYNGIIEYCTSKIHFFWIEDLIHSNERNKKISSRLNSFQIIIRLPKGAFSSFVVVRASFTFFITS